LDALVVVTRGLRHGEAPARHRGGIQRKIEPPCDFAGEQRGLVESAPPQAPPMQRHRDDHIVILSRQRQLVAQVLRQCAPGGLIEAVLVAANQRRQAAGFVLGRGSIARDSARDSIAWRMRKASGASRRTADGGLKRSAAYFATRLRHPLDLRQASNANAPSLSGPGCKPVSACRASRWIQKV